MCGSPSSRPRNESARHDALVGLQGDLRRAIQLVENEDHRYLDSVVYMRQGQLSMLRYPRMRRYCPFLLGDALIEREPRRLVVPLDKARPDTSLSTLFYTAPSNH